MGTASTLQLLRDAHQRRQAPANGVAPARQVQTPGPQSAPEKILMTAFELEEQGQSPFSAESLVVAAWQKYPATFGLKGYSDLHPDSNKVLAYLMGVKGMVRRGWLAKLGQKLYALTRDGKQVVRRLFEEAVEEKHL